MLTRKMLKAFGIDETIIDQIIDAHAETVDALKKERDDYRAVAEQVDTLKAELKQAQADNSGNENYKDLYESERAAFGEYKAQVESDRNKAQRETLYRELLRMNGIDPKRHDAIMRVTDLSALELDENGALSNANALSDTIKNEWSDFVVSTTTQGAKPDTPPKTSGGRTKADIMGIKDAAERQQAIAENLDLFQ